MIAKIGNHILHVGVANAVIPETEIAKCQIHTTNKMPPVTALLRQIAITRRERILSRVCQQQVAAPALPPDLWSAAFLLLSRFSLRYSTIRIILILQPSTNQPATRCKAIAQPCPRLPKRLQKSHQAVPPTRQLNRLPMLRLPNPMSLIHKAPHQKPVLPQRSQTRQFNPSAQPAFSTSAMGGHACVPALSISETCRAYI